MRRLHFKYLVWGSITVAGVCSGLSSHAQNCRSSPTPSDQVSAYRHKTVLSAFQEAFIAQNNDFYSYSPAQQEVLRASYVDYPRRLFVMLSSPDQKKVLDSLVNTAITGSAYAQFALTTLGSEAKPALEKLKASKFPGDSKVVRSIEDALRKPRFSMDAYEQEIKSIPICPRASPETCLEAAITIFNRNTSMSRINLGYTKNGVGGREGFMGDQPLSPKQPRAILSNIMGDRILSFSGHERKNKDTGRDIRNLELAFTDDYAQTEPAEVVLKPVANGYKAELIRRPHRCYACHTSDHKLKWGPYEQWDHFVGSDNQFLAPGSTERSIRDEFFRDGIKQPLYRMIPDTLKNSYTTQAELPADDPRRSAVTTYNFASDGDKAGLGKYGDRRDQNNRIVSRPNTTLGIAFAYLNSWRLTRKVKESLPYDFYKYAIEGALLNCPNFEEFIPPEVRQLHNRKLASIEDEMAQRTARWTGNDNPHLYRGAVSRLRYLFEGRGIHDGRSTSGIQGWFVVDQPGAEYSDNLARTNARHTLENSIALAAKQLRDLDPDLREAQPTKLIDRVANQMVGSWRCQELRRQSLEALRCLAPTKITEHGSSQTPSGVHKAN